MLFPSVLILTIVATHGTDLECEERLDVIGSRAWPALPTEYFGRDLLEDARLVAVGHMTEGTHGLVHTEGKRTYLRGSSNHFHLYASDITRELIEIRGLRVKDARFCQYETCLFILTADGSIWTMGQNDKGQLANGTQDRNVLAKVEGLPRVRQMAVGDEFCVVLTRDGELISWGNNEHKRLGYSTTSNINPTPRHIALSVDMSPAEHVCCGYHHCALLTENSKVFTWGDSSFIGRPRGDGTPQQVVGISENENVIKITCGSSHTLALTTSGKLYGWGNSVEGQLLQADNNAPQATALDLNGRVLRDVVAGRVATIVRTFSPFAEYFGRYNGTNYDTPQLARSMMHGRDVMAKSQYGQDTWGSVRLGCRGEGY